VSNADNVWEALAQRVIREVIERHYTHENLRKNILGPYNPEGQVEQSITAAFEDSRRKTGKALQYLATNINQDSTKSEILNASSRAFSLTEKSGQPFSNIEVWKLADFLSLMAIGCLKGKDQEGIASDLGDHIFSKR